MPKLCDSPRTVITDDSIFPTRRTTEKNGFSTLERNNMIILIHTVAYMNCFVFSTLTPEVNGKTLQFAFFLILCCFYSQPPTILR